MSTSTRSANWETTSLARPSFTLTELIVVMAIIAIMMSMVAAAMSGALADARKQRTAMIITKIDRLIMEKVNEYRFRSVRLQYPPARTQQQVDAINLSGNRWRLYALRDLMRMELPDRYSDFVRYTAPPNSQSAPPVFPIGPAVLNVAEIQANIFSSDVFSNPYNVIDQEEVGLRSTPAVTLGYLRAVQNNSERMNPVDPSNPPNRIQPAKPPYTTDFEGAECLYLILSQMRDGDRTALANFARDEIGDFDNDGMKEILDGWGRPISFVRWAPGFVSNPPDWGNAPFEDDGGTVAANSGYPALTTQSIIQQDLNTGNSLFPELDQFETIDLLRVDMRWTFPSQNPTGGSINWRWRPFALRPLIFSNGPDKQADIRLTYDAPQNGAFLPAGTPFRYDLTGVAPDTKISRQLSNGPYWIPTDPYALAIGPNGGIEPWIGACYDTNGNWRAEYTDNITNHAIELGGENNQ